MKRAEDLRRILEAIDRKSYPAYKDTRGGYRFGSYTLLLSMCRAIRLQPRRG